MRPSTALGRPGQAPVAPVDMRARQPLRARAESASEASTSPANASAPTPQSRRGPLSTGLRANLLGVGPYRRKLLSGVRASASDNPDYRQYRGANLPYNPYNPYGSYSKRSYNEYLTGETLMPARLCGAAASPSGCGCAGTSGISGPTSALRSWGAVGPIGAFV